MLKERSLIASSQSHPSFILAKEILPNEIKFLIAPNIKLYINIYISQRTKSILSLALISLEKKRVNTSAIHLLP